MEVINKHLNFESIGRPAGVLTDHEKMEYFRQYRFHEPINALTSFTRNLDEYKLLIAAFVFAGGNLNDCESFAYGRTPLICAALKGKYEFINALIEAGAHARVKGGKEHITPLKHAENAYSKFLITPEQYEKVKAVLGPAEKEPTKEGACVIF